MAKAARITMVDVGREAGVSAMTVSRALRQPDTVSSQTRSRVLAIMDRLGFVPDRSAETLSTRQSGFIAMVIPSLNNSNFADTIRGLTDILHRRGLQLLVGFSDYSVRREEEIVETMLKRRPEGIILTGARSRQTDRARHLLQMAGIPVIETWDVPDDPIDHVVGFSNFDAAQLMVQHLVSRGYRKIAFLGGASRGTRDYDRHAGYCAALKKLGLARTTISTGPPPATMEAGGKAIAQLLERRPDADSVICVSDLLAFGGLMECQRRGLDVPRQVAVAGFGDFDVGRWSYPSITTIRVGSYEIGLRAGELMLATLKQLREGKSIGPTLIETKLTVIQREST
jgi:LacI family transcriptional regulator, gluconate utilization system Gnt-I transcriptional repressor